MKSNHGKIVDEKALTVYALVEETPTKEITNTQSVLSPTAACNESEYQPETSSDDEEYDTSYDYTDVNLTENELKRKAVRSNTMCSDLVKLLPKKAKKKQKIRLKL